MGYSKPEICDRTYQFSLRIVKLCLFLEEQGNVSKILSNQVLRSGTSIGANVREAQSAQSDRDFLHKLEIALKEARETEYWLELLRDSELVKAKKLAELINESKELCRILISITRKVKHNNKP